MIPRLSVLAVIACFLLLAGRSFAADTAPNLLPDPSIEETQPPNQFGIPYKKWGGWKFEGDVAFRNGKIARTGVTSAEMDGSQGGKMRLYSPAVTVDPGRYRFSCFIRGLDVGVHPWGMSEDVHFVNEQYYNLKKTGTFGWTPLSIVQDVPKRQEVVASIGLLAPGRLWVDDGSLVRVSDETPLTNGPVLGAEEAPIQPPGHLDAATAVNCPDCGYRNMPAWKKCYACGADLTQGSTAVTGPPVKLLASFEDGTVRPFDGGTALTDHATDGRYSLRIDKGYSSWDGAQDWTGYDFLEADVFNAADVPQTVFVEIRDRDTRDYWTRVNYTTAVPPGASTLIVPTDIYVGEKSRPGRALEKADVNRLVLGLDNAKSPIYFDRIRLERDLSDKVKVPGLKAFDFGPGSSPPFRGFTAVTPSTLYSPGRGYGLKNAHIWRAFDVLQPDPLYETFICIESGGFAVDLPNGRYHCWVNIDSPSGFWGEYQTYRTRTIKANGSTVLHETMDLDQFRQKYFRFADTDDSPRDNTFDKYQRVYFKEKEFDAEVKDGQLFIEFLGENWANCVSALVIYPADQDALGRQYLDNLQERRRFYFDNYFKRVLPDPHRDVRGVVPELAPTPDEMNKGYVLFARDFMLDVGVNAVPRRDEVTTDLRTFASAGEMAPLVFSVYPLKNRGTARVSVGELTSTAGVLPASAIDVGVVSHRITRVTPEGTVYTIAPRFILPRDHADLKLGTTTTFWLTLHAPRTVHPGTYAGRISLTFDDGAVDHLDVSVRLFATPLDELDVPAGPWGCEIDLPWYGEDLGDYRKTMLRKCLDKLRSYGCTSFSGIPSLSIKSWKDGKPTFDFTRADDEMVAARAAGFHSTVVNYNGGIGGFNNYSIDESAMKAAGFTHYTDFLHAVLTTVDEHARMANWLPVAYNLCDEPIGDAAKAAAENARAWRSAAPPSVLTTGATSVESPKPDDPALGLATALKIANLNGHDEASVKAIHDAGGDWAFYNGGSRWTFGTYMFKCAHQYGMRFRLSWHFNASAGDPYYALDCREDDYSWLATNAKMELIPSIHFEREIREGIDDYRYIQTLDRLIRKNAKTPAAVTAQKLIDDKLSSFALGDRDHDARWPVEEYRTFRLNLAEAIEKLAG